MTTATKSHRVKSTGFATRAEFEAAVNQVARMQTELRSTEVARDEEIQGVQADYEARIAALKVEIDAEVTRAEKFAATHRDELLPAEKKSAETELASYGFRTGQPTLKPLSRSWTWRAIVEALERKFGERFLRVTKEADKDLIKAQLGDDAGQLAAVGLRVTQDESFWIEPKVEGGAAVKAG